MLWVAFWGKHSWHPEGCLRQMLKPTKDRHTAVSPYLMFLSPLPGSLPSLPVVLRLLLWLCFLPPCVVEEN